MDKIEIEDGDRGRRPFSFLRPLFRDKAVWVFRLIGLPLWYVKVQHRFAFWPPRIEFMLKSPQSPERRLHRYSRQVARRPHDPLSVRPPRRRHRKRVGLQLQERRYRGRHAERAAGG